MRTWSPVAKGIHSWDDGKWQSRRKVNFKRWTLMFSVMLVCMVELCQVLETNNRLGWTQDLSGSVCDRALSHIDGCYNIPNVHVRGRLAKTNTMSNTAFRGFGGPQGIFIGETMMEEV